MKIIESYTKSLIIFIVFGSIYFIMENIYDGSSHWSMFVCAGLTGILADYIEKYFFEMKVLNKILIITANILVLEYIVGYIFNIYLQMNIWDYSENHYNLSGQICLLFALIWFFIFGPLIIWFVLKIKYIFFNEEKPRRFYYYYIQLFKDLLDMPYVIIHKLKSLNIFHKKKA